MRVLQFWSIIFCLLATLYLTHARGNVDQVPQSAPLNEVPISFDGWTSQEIPINAATLEVLGNGDFLNRVYTMRQPGSAKPGTTRTQLAPVQLFIAYFPTQRTGQAIHSPQNCLPGAGWAFLSSGIATFQDRTGKDYRVGDYVISDGRDKQEVLYWYQSHGNSIASDYSAKLHMLADSIRLGRTDAALVRLITPVGQDEDRDVAHQRLVNFAKYVTPILPAYVPN